MAPLAEQFNQETQTEWEAVRDFIILHYKQTQRDDSEFWNFYRTMEIPDTLAHRIEMFRENGYVWPDQANLFRSHSWIQVMFGQGLFPKHTHGATRILPAESLKVELAKVATSVNQNVAKLPGHEEFIKQYCPAHG
jgi:tryptophan halogenase